MTKRKTTKKKTKATRATKKRAPRKAKSSSLLVRNARIVTMNADDDILRGDLLIDKGVIERVAPKIDAKGVGEVLDAEGCIVMPGFVQAHIHLCQTLFRAQADDMELLTWLRERVWPLEGALDKSSMRASAELGIAELLMGGTTAILDMGSVGHTDTLFETARKMGIRYSGGKTIMDRGQGYPVGLRETTDEAIAESIRLCEAWHDTAKGRLRYAFSPRFALSCTDEAMRRCVGEARKRGALLHTHASENPEEVAIIRERTGMGNVEFLHSLGFSGSDVVLAHGIWVSAKERQILASTRTRVVHCPSANLKLASGIARIAELVADEIPVALGADGAACNNSLDAFVEMRLCALLHKVRNGPGAVPARMALRIATQRGAHALGLNEVGTVEVGKRADLVLLDLHKPHVMPDAGDLLSRIVYSARASDVRTVMVDGSVLVRDGELMGANVNKIIKTAQKEAAALCARAL